MRKAPVCGSTHVVRKLPDSGLITCENHFPIIPDKNAPSRFHKLLFVLYYITYGGLYKLVLFPPVCTPIGVQTHSTWGPFAPSRHLCPSEIRHRDSLPVMYALELVATLRISVSGPSAQGPSGCLGLSLHIVQEGGKRMLTREDGARSTRCVRHWSSNAGQRLIELSRGPGRCS